MKTKRRRPLGPVAQQVVAEMESLAERFQVLRKSIEFGFCKFAPEELDIARYVLQDTLIKLEELEAELAERAPGRPNRVITQVIDGLRSELGSGSLTPETLRREPIKQVAYRYDVSRDTARRAVAAVLSPAAVPLKKSGQRHR